MAPSRSNQSKPVDLDIEAVFNRVYKMLEESEVEPKIAIQPRLNSKAEEVSNDAENDISLEDISSSDEELSCYDNNSTQEVFTDGSDDESVQEFRPISCSSLEYQNIPESIPDEKADFHGSYNSDGSEPIHEYHIICRRPVWVFTCEMCKVNDCDRYIHQRIHEVVEDMRGMMARSVFGF